MSLHSGMWAVMFTDIVGSTEQRARLGDHVGDALRRVHDDVVHAAVATHGGEVVKGTGDGTMAAFSGAADALDAAVAILQGIERRNRDADEPLALRIGISLGDLVHEADDLHGLAANEAARLCALADANEVVVSDLVRAVAGSRAACTFTDRAERTLRGIPQPVVTWTVVWAPTSEQRADLPAPLGVTRDALAFAGRATELDRLVAAFARGADGAPHAMFVSGEPGIGKTRLAAEAAHVALDQGAVVLFGRCDDLLGVPFQPFAEMLDWYVRHADPVQLGRYPGDLTRLSASVRDRFPTVPPPLRADPETEQYRLFDAVAGWFHAVAATAPLVVVVDDLHWATRPTLLMLRHVLAKADDLRLLVIVTYRDTDLDRQHPLASMLADFRRLPDFARVALGGLDEDSVRDLLEATAQQSLGDDGRAFARTLAVETDGNPFFIQEVLRHLNEAGVVVERDGRWVASSTIAELGIPEGIKEVLGQRLDRLGADATIVLQAAAVVGREFDLDVVGAASGLDDTATVNALDAAVRARVIDEAGPDRFRFTHALVRSALEDELTSARRVRLHVQVAEHLERAHPDNLQALADHWLEASFAGDPDRAVRYAIAAAESASSRGAFDEATVILERAAGLAAQGLVDPAVARETAVLLGTAQRLAGDGAYRTTLLAVARDAERDHDVTTLVRAALALNRGLWSNSLMVDDERVAVCEVALAALGDVPTPDRARLLATLAAELTFSPADRRQVLVAEARAIAHTVGDPALLGEVDALSVSTLWGDPQNAAAAQPGLTAAEQQGQPTLRFLGLDAQRTIAMIAGDHRTAREILGRQRALVADVPFGFGRWQCAIQEFLFASVAGDLAGAEALMRTALAIGEETGQPDAQLVAVTQLAGLQLDRGVEEADIAALHDAASSDVAAPETRLFRVGIARRLARRGDREQARELMHVEGAAGYDYFTWTVVSVGYWCALGELAVDLDDREMAEHAWDALVPHRREAQYVSGGTGGSVARDLGCLATLLGRFDLAAELLAEAEAMHVEMEAPLFLARTWADRARLELARGGDPHVARALVAHASATARDLGAFGVDAYVAKVFGG